MLADLITKKNQRDKAIEEIESLERKTNYKARRAEDDAVVKEIEERKGQTNIGCFNAIIWVIGFIWIGVAFDTFYPREWNITAIIITFLPAPIMALFGAFYYYAIKDSKEAKKDLKKIQNMKNSNLEKLDNYKKIALNLNKEIEILETKYAEKSNEYFTKTFDKNNNGEIDSLENKDDFLKYLQANQDKIIEVSEKMGDDYIHVLVKINDKLNLKRESINKSLAEVMKIKNGFSESSNIDVYESFIKDEIQYYNSLLANSLFMASSLVNNDRITFRTIYEKFDKLNIFNSHYENQTLKLLNSINNNLVKIIQEINELNFSVTSAIQDLTYATQENTEKITQELQKIDSSINFNTLVAGINAYQNYKISKNTKSLRS